MDVLFGQFKKKSWKRVGNGLKQGHCHQLLEAPARAKLQVSLNYTVRKWKGGRKEAREREGRRGRKDG